MTRRPSVLLADDHQIVLEGLQRILENHCGLVESVRDGRAMLEAERLHRPQVIVADVQMPLLSGIDAARELRRRGSRARVIFLSMHSDKEFATEALRAGARGYVLKSSAGAELLKAIHEVMEGRIYIAPEIANGDVFPFEAAYREPSIDRDRLTVREKEVLTLVAEGKSLKEIAAVLEVAVRTVVFHKSNMMSKLGLRTTADITKYAMKHGLAAG